jgi:uncharacterized membrane protein YdjX (TVP38/TMEM64 family)
MPPSRDPQDENVLAAIRRRLRRAGLILLVIIPFAVAAIWALGWHRVLSLTSLIHYRASLATVIATYPVSALAAYIACYAIAMGCSVPGGIFLNIGGGVFFGGLLGGITAIFAGTLGATGTFLLGKFVVRRPLMHWIGPQADRFATGFRADGFSYLLLMRLIPVVPLSLANVLPALCGVRIATFVAATFLGIAPMTLALAFFGAGLDSTLAVPIAQYSACVEVAQPDCHIRFSLWMAVTPQFVVGLVALGIAALAPVALKYYRQRGNVS